MTIQTTNKGRNYSQIETGKCDQWPDYSVKLTSINLPGKLFIKDLLELTGCEISINSMKPGEGMPIYHQHHLNEEIYIFIKGRGQIQIDGDILNVREGSIVRINPEGERIWRNNSDDMLVYIIIQTKQNSLEDYGLHDSSVPDKAPNWR
jgi:mannose-6-phosphate isomerase-like protein (cupin superfamily)